MEPIVSVVIVTHNSEQYIDACLASVYSHSVAQPMELLVIDNASDDDTVKLVKEKYPDVKVLLNAKNLGFGAANNLGASHASGRYLFFLNPDTLLLNDAIGIFCKYLTELEPDSRIVCCGGNLTDTEGQPAISWGNLPSFGQLMSDLTLRKLSPKYYNRHRTVAGVCTSGEIRKVPYISGADLFIDRHIFTRMGGFDEHYFMYYEDADLGFRLKRAAYFSSLIPVARITHHESRSTQTHAEYNWKKYEMLEKSKYLYFRKNHGRFVAWSAKKVQLLILLVHRISRGADMPTGKLISITRAA